jgi:hypothetical protein
MSGAGVAATSLFSAAKQSPEPAMMQTPCALLTPDVAKRLPWFIKPADVLCMSVTREDVQVSEHARLLLNELGGRLQSEGRFSNATAEYDRGIAAYAEGRYIEAVSHLQVAISSAR